jgi:hypothetical protein
MHTMHNGSTAFNMYSPTAQGDNLPSPALRDVALQVAFERHTLKPVFHLIGYRLWV